MSVSLPDTLPILVLALPYIQLPDVLPGEDFFIHTCLLLGMLIINLSGLKFTYMCLLLMR